MYQIWGKYHDVEVPNGDGTYHTVRAHDSFGKPVVTAAYLVDSKSPNWGKHVRQLEAEGCRLLYALGEISEAKARFVFERFLGDRKEWWRREQLRGPVLVDDARPDRAIFYPERSKGDG